ncbi:hypothetical protein K2173_001171 [Erythroxylum novogranatense]|uniref:Calmodulin-binding protein n=1 Tax=Erythroxylum novogranatense TaxID=1862640 RepID=A0AAV8TJQ7_9ROSI|nr:hypothetical protein K2173_001171 [Erythroxylum novogranatense]
MEVEVPLEPTDFNFDSSACSSPYMTAPSSPQPFGNYFFSAPTSPTRMSALCRELRGGNICSKSRRHENDDEEKKNRTRKEEQDGGDFEFSFSGHLELTSLSAEELFDRGKIRPLKPPPGLDYSSLSSRTMREFDPFQVEASRRECNNHLNQEPEQQVPRHRGRERISRSSSSCQARKGSRSLSPLRVSDIVFEDNQDGTVSTSNKITCTSTTATSNSSTKSSYSHRKWNLKDFLLFRSASEGRATSKDPLANYLVLSKKEALEDVRNSSFRSMDRLGSSRRRGPPVSAHEMHYTVNRAVSEGMKRRTYLPYRQGLLGCLGANAAAVHEISRGVGSLTRV